MNKPTLSLALSASISIAQAGWQAVSAEQSADAMKSVSDAGAVKKSGINTQVKKKTLRSAQAVKSAPSITTNKVGLNPDHAMLFFSTKGNDAGALSAEAAPAAALSIHPSLPANSAENSSPPESRTSPTTADAGEIPIDESIKNKSFGNSQLKSDDLIAQFAADNLLAQNQGGDVTASPIPPVVTGTVDLEEFKSTNVIDLNVSRSRTFKLRNKIVRTSISDPGIAEPVVVAENQIVLLGKAPGKATLVLWDDAGNSAAIDLRVTRDYSQLQSTLREIDPRIIVKAYSVGGSDRLILLGDVDHTESVVRAFAAANVFMDDRGMNIQVANNRMITEGVGERTRGGTTGAGGAQTGALAQLNSVDRYLFFPNLPNNIGTAQGIVSDGGRVTSLIKVRKVPLIVLHVTFMEMNTSAARSLGVSLGLSQATSGFNFGIGGTPLPVPYTDNYLLSYGGANQINPMVTRAPLFNGAGTQQGNPTRNGIVGAYSSTPVALVTPQTGSLGNSGNSLMYGLGLPTFAN
ncbi:MAG: pilus assembly protein N-terminal domain-containing protein, partial [Cyanobacteria bacterium]|nr:pilus assembly protein N-terminal domain-containing protein [Cyanobacteriota bacterium]